MQDRTIEKIRKYKRDHNMKQTEHGLVVIECRLKKEYLAGSDYANAYITVSVPFYDASLRELSGWLQESFPGLERVDDVCNIQVQGHKMELFQLAHGRPDKNGNAPILLTFRIMNRSTFKGLEDLSMASIQKLFDSACGLQEQADATEDTADASPASIVL
jgi:hypothetical protein